MNLINFAGTISRQVKSNLHVCTANNILERKREVWHHVAKDGLQVLASGFIFSLF
jgi:hypothetical protein